MELLAPAGSFPSAVYAFRNGADAVYAGMSLFSARSAAQNFSFTELRRLKTIALQEGKKIYIALNTLIEEHELPQLTALLHQCAYLCVDGIIIQDLGVYRLARKHIPEIPIHGSTQMAVHNVEGVRQLIGMGFKRVVLSRELLIDEIAQIISEEPGIEYEVFIHGALCFSFSGLCLASGKLLGRSANRGMCAQICRTWFSRDTQRGYFFSMKDLKAPQHIQTLKAIGVNSCKIEGRMKGPEYTGTVSAFYRSIIDTGRRNAGLEEQLQGIFSRDTSSGWLEKTDTSLTTPAYASHRGIPAGTIVKVQDAWAEVTLETALSIRDGIMILIPEDSLEIPKKFSVSSMKLPSGTPVTSAGKGQVILLKIPVSAAPGTAVYKISDHSQNWPKVQESSAAPFRHPMDVQLLITDESLRVSSHFPWTAACREISREFPTEIQKSKSPFSMKERLQKIFASSGESLFCLGTFQWDNQSSLPDDRIFIPPGTLKKIRRAWYAYLDGVFPEVLQPESVSSPMAASLEIPLRKALNPRSVHPLPFLTDPDLYSPDDIASDEGHMYLPLNPVVFSPRKYEKSLQLLIDKCFQRSPGKKTVLGINNLGHIPMVHRLSQKYGVSVWIDVYLYLANLQAAFQVRDMLTFEPLFGYYWIETLNKPNHIPWPFPVAQVEREFSPPLFISRTGSDTKYAGSNQQIITQRGKEFCVIESGGLTYLLES